MSGMTDRVLNYLNQMRHVTLINGGLLEPEGIYAGIEGHRRFAREMGYALNDFDEKERKDILQDSFGMVYVTACHLRPLLDAKEWMSIMESQIKEKQHNEH